MELTNEDILLKLNSTEDHFIERKTRQDKKRDWLKTVVAFANSTPIGYPSILFLGVKDNGKIEDDCDCDQIQKDLTEEIKKAFPPIYVITKVLQKEGKDFVACIVPGSGLRPHFAGPAYIRKGSASHGASDEQFTLLIAQRNSKSYELQKWISKKITLEWINRAAQVVASSGRSAIKSCVEILECNQHDLTFKHDRGGIVESAPLEELRLSYDHEKDCLKIERDWSI